MRCRQIRRSIGPFGNSNVTVDTQARKVTYIFFLHKGFSPMTPNEIQGHFRPYTGKFIEVFKGPTFARYTYFEKTESGIFIPAGRKLEDGTRVLVPLAESEAAWHLAGYRPAVTGLVVRWLPVRLGSYPLEDCKYCRWVGSDIDNHTTEDSRAIRLLVESCWKVVIAGEKYGMKIYLERSNSGNGVHLFCFFNELVLAKTARRLLFRLISAAGILTETVITTKHGRERTVLIVENSGGAAFDRLFPTQDEVKPGQLGNLMSLPYNGLGKWKAGRTAFLDLGTSGKLPEDDSWPIVKLSEFLGTVKRHSAIEVDAANKALIATGFNMEPPGARRSTIGPRKRGSRFGGSRGGHGGEYAGVDWLEYLKVNGIEVAFTTSSSAILAECPYCGDAKKAWVSLKSGWLNCWHLSCDACEETGLAPSVWIPELGLSKPSKRGR